MTRGKKDQRLRKEFVKTIEEAVERILAGLSEEDKATVRNTKRQDLIMFHHGWGTGIRNEFGLWGENTELLSTLPPSRRHADDVSMLIIDAVWSRLQQEMPR